MLVSQLFESAAGSTSASISCMRGCYSNMALGTVKRAIGMDEWGILDGVCGKLFFTLVMNYWLKKIVKETLYST